MKPYEFNDHDLARDERTHDRTALWVRLLTFVAVLAVVFGMLFAMAKGVAGR